MLGVNLYAGQFGGANGVYGQDYIYPGKSYLQYYASKGMDTVRIPFDWERIQPTKDGPLSTTELGRLDAVVNNAKALGLTVVLDPHNYGYAYGGLIGTTVSNASFADFWSKLAGHYKDAANVVFGLMNEPHDQSAAQWIVSANAAVEAIRDTGATQMILVPGSYWSGAYSWVSGVPDRANSDDNDTVVGQGVVDPLNNYAFDVHTYFDGNNAGLGNTVSATIGVDKLRAITAWAEATGHKLFAGEFGTDTSELSQKALDNMLAYMDEHPVWIGGTYWAGGPWIGDYKFSVEPTTLNGVVTDKPQLGILQRYDMKANALPADLVAGVNVGGLVGYTDKDTGVYYRPDGASNPSQFLSGTSKVTDVTALVSGTSDDTIYQSVRTGKAFGYDVAVANGTYAVELQFDETYWSANGKRVFDVLLEGQEVVSNLDVYALAGKNAAYNLTRTVTVTDGQLNIRFDASGSDDRDNATVSGFAVRKISSSGPGDTSAPIASGGAADLVSASANHKAVVTYTDVGLGVDFATIGTNDLTVSGPGGVTVSGVTTQANPDGSVTATYTLLSPSGFTAADNGSYTIALVGGAVKDLAGNGVAAVASLDTFTVAIGSSPPPNAITGTEGVDSLTGTSGADVMYGLGGNDKIDGKAGADAMTGGAGNDVYFVDNVNDIVVEDAGGGSDRVESFVTYTLSAQVENLLLRGGSAISGTGNELNNGLTGNTAVNVLSGLDGQDTLSGAGGNDVLSGGLGNDVFVFNTALNGTSNVDQISDFTAGADKLHLDNAIFTAVGANGALAAGAFQLGAVALQADDRILYDQGTGALSYDADGNGAGAAIRFAILTTKPALTSTDFLII